VKTQDSYETTVLTYDLAPCSLQTSLVSDEQEINVTDLPTTSSQVVPPLN